MESPTLYIPYTPIVIKFQPSVVVQQPNSSIDTNFSKFYLKIISPTSPTPTVGQSLGESTLVPVPSDGILKLQLIPSLNYNEKGGYIVQYFKSPNVIKPFRTERWVVPRKPLPRVLDINILPSNQNSINLIEPVFSVTTIEPYLPYKIVYDSIVWLQDLPQPNSKISISYQPGVTLHTLTTLGSETSNSNTFASGYNYFY